MQDRIREILQEQIAMKGGKECRKGNRWIMFLQEMEKKLGIPYAEAMVDPQVKKLYREVYGPIKKNGGLTVGGYGTKKGAKKNEWDRYLEQEHIDPRQAEMQGYDAFEMDGGELIGGKGTKEGAKKNKWINFFKNDYVKQKGVKYTDAYKLFKQGKYGDINKAIIKYGEPIKARRKRATRKRATKKATRKRATKRATKKSTITKTILNKMSKDQLIKKYSTKMRKGDIINLILKK